MFNIFTILLSNVQNHDFFQLVTSAVQHQFYLNNVIRKHLVELNGSLTTKYLQKFISSLFENFFIPKELS